jgi:tetratricopeptide (TPR) repeat protein
MNWRGRIFLALLITFGLSLVMVNLTRERGFAESVPILIGVSIALVIAQFGLLRLGMNRGGMLAQAQQAFVTGDMTGVVTLVETARSGDEPVSTKALTLLGNAYRQLSDYDQSLDVLQAALHTAPDDPFPLYGLGRSLLVMGRYPEAVAYLQKALQNGARKATRSDYVLALYLADTDPETLRTACFQASQVLRMEAYRALMVNYILYQTYVADETSQQKTLALKIMRNTADALAWWQAEAQRHASTAYGQSLGRELENLQALLN